LLIVTHYQDSNWWNVLGVLDLCFDESLQSRNSGRNRVII